MRFAALYKHLNFHKFCEYNIKVLGHNGFSNNLCENIVLKELQDPCGR